MGPPVARPAKVLGEGVETSAQRSSLLKAGCGSFQGFLYSRPVGADEVAALVAGQGALKVA